MNYIDLINQFWTIRRSRKITPAQAYLYFGLLQECNERGWENPFEYPNESICARIGISEPTMIDARARLKQLGLIDFERGVRNKQSPKYYLNNLSRNRAKTELNPSRTPNFKYKNKTKQDNIPPIAPPPVPTLPFKEDKGEKSGRVKKEFVPPTLEEVLDFFSGSLLSDWENQGRLFFSHYNSQGWRKGTGVQVTAWDSLANKWILDEKIKRDGSNKDEPNGKDRKRCVIRSVSFG